MGLARVVDRPSTGSSPRMYAVHRATLPIDVDSAHTHPNRATKSSAPRCMPPCHTRVTLSINFAYGFKLDSSSDEGYSGGSVGFFFADRLGAITEKDLSRVRNAKVRSSILLGSTNSSLLHQRSSIDE